MQHYVCTGDCGGESERPKVCDFGGCTKENQALTACSCDDGLHHAVLSSPVVDVLDIDSMDDEDNL